MFFGCVELIHVIYNCVEVIDMLESVINIHSFGI